MDHEYFLAGRASQEEGVNAKRDTPRPALHPQIAEVFRQKATLLATAPTHDVARDAARPAPRGFIERIEIPPDGLLQVVGRFGEMLTAASDGAVTAAVGNLVAGACNPLNVELSWATA